MMNSFSRYWKQADSMWSEMISWVIKNAYTCTKKSPVFYMAIRNKSLSTWSLLKLRIMASSTLTILWQEIIYSMALNLIVFP